MTFLDTLSGPPTNRMKCWVRFNKPQTPMGILSANSYLLRAHVHVLQAFNAGTSNTLTVGFTGTTNAFVTSVDVSSTGVKSVTLGTGSGYQSTAHSVVAYYAGTGASATQGKALVILEQIPVPAQP